ncbi:MAG: transcriptional repressor [Deltaproteobacteria bacterium]|nr:transcriptional repressor [Deltaproteobacteria bacterium]
MIDMVSARKKMELFPSACRGAGLKVTPQRVAVYGMLLKTDSHPSAEEVYHVIRAAIPSISLGTVYKILDTLHNQGFLRRVATSRQTARYDARVEPHHHTLCEQCGKIQDVDVALEPELVHLEKSTEDFRVKIPEVVFHGTCGDCAQPAPVVH